jgi:hypothetical protein
LVAKLNESTAEGWEVVAIVPTGGDVSAFLRREAPASDDGAEAAVDETGAETAADETPAGEGADALVADAWVAEGVTAEPAADEAAEAGVGEAADETAAATSDEPSFAWGAGAATEAATEADEAVEVPIADTSPVEEPAGWAAAPIATEEPASVEQAGAGIGDATVTDGSPVEAEEVTVAETVEPEPVPEPVNPEPAAVVTTPAGWYPDPSGRFELRYWDATQWTEHVARAGQQFTDPPVR